MFFQWFPIAHVLWAQEAPCILSPWVFIQAMWCPKMFLRFRYSLIVKKWQCRSKWSKDYFSTGLIPDYIDCKYFAGKPVSTNNFGLCFAAKKRFYQHFLATTFFHLATKKKISVASWCLPKKVNFRPWLSVCLYVIFTLCTWKCLFDIFSGPEETPDFP